MGIIGMKVMGRGGIIADGIASASDLLRYVAHFVDTSIVGCSSIFEVRQNLLAARTMSSPMKDDERVALEARVLPRGIPVTQNLAPRPSERCEFV